MAKEYTMLRSDLLSQIKRYKILLKEAETELFITKTKDGKSANEFILKIHSLKKLLEGARTYARINSFDTIIKYVVANKRFKATLVNLSSVGACIEIED